MSQSFEGEYELEADYPVYLGYWYVVNGEPWKSDRRCTVRDLKSMHAQHDGTVVKIATVTNCNIRKRGLQPSQYVKPFHIATASDLGLDL